MADEKSKDTVWAQQARALVEAFLKNETSSYGLNPQRILEVAKEAVSRRGYVLYDDYNADLLIEVLNGVRPCTVGFRLFYIKSVLQAYLWQYQGKSRFNPPV